MAKGTSNIGIPELSFSWKRALGITQAKQKIARQTGIPTTKAGIERKIGQMIIKSIFTPVRDKIAISCMLIQIREFSSHAITHELYIKNRKRLFCL